MKRKKFWIGAAACMLIGTASVAASSGVELHECKWREGNVPAGHI